YADLAREPFRIAPDGGRGRDGQLADDAVNGWAASDFFGRGLLGGTQGEVRLVVFAPLEERAGGVDEQACSAFGESDGVQVDAASHVNGGSGISEGDGDVDPVLFGVGRAEPGSAQVAVHAEPFRGAVGLG